MDLQFDQSMFQTSSSALQSFTPPSKPPLRSSKSYFTTLCTSVASWPARSSGPGTKNGFHVPVLAVRSAATSLGCEGLAHSLLDLFVQLLDEPATQGSSSHTSAALTRSSIKTSRIDLSFPARWACSRRFCICASQVGVSLRSNTCTSEIS